MQSEGSGRSPDAAVVLAVTALAPQLKWATTFFLPLPPPLLTFKVSQHCGIPRSHMLRGRSIVQSKLPKGV